jgi:PAS domain S-box-containing protein
MISTHWRERHEPTEGALQLFDVLARQAADLIERTKSEEALRRGEEQSRLFASIVEASDDAIVSHNLDGIISSWNRGAERIFGFTAEEVLGEPITKLIPVDRRDEEAGNIENIRRGERTTPYETIRQRKDGSQLDIAVAISPIRNAAGNIIGAARISRDITERKQAEARIALLTREAEHRTKNVLMTVQAAVRLTRADTADGVKQVIQGRIQALLNVHRLFAESRWEGADIQRLVSEELAAYSHDGDERIRISGPKCLLKPNTAQALAMTLHELATNAAKYGSLSVPEGHVIVKWYGGGDGPIVLRWIERDGPSVVPAKHQGLGTRVIQNTVRNQLNGELRLDWRPEGLACEIILPTV